jgi:hypothetical protein
VEESAQTVSFCTLNRQPDKYKDSLVTLRVRVKSFRHGLTGYVSLAGFFQRENKLIITGRQDDTRNASLKIEWLPGPMTLRGDSE